MEVLLKNLLQTESSPEIPDFLKSELENLACPPKLPPIKKPKVDCSVPQTPPKTPEENKLQQEEIVEDIKKKDEEDVDVIYDASVRPDKTKRQPMCHDEIVQSSYGLQIPFFQKFCVVETEKPTMAKLAKRARRLLELRETVGPIYEESTPTNAKTPMFFDFGQCPWMQDVRDRPQLNPFRENQKHIEKIERMRAQEKQDRETMEKMAYGAQLMETVMIEGAKYGDLQKYLMTKPEKEQRHIMETIAFMNSTQQNAAAAYSNGSGASNGGIGIANPAR